jgi:RHH-type transcriptional regulator, proline utilization regulon repressor / proline dehydrogenase / delta 1-pyrroline-5-carboxylate dehydrogenase
MATSLDAQTTALARQIAELGAGERSKVFRMSFWSERMLDWAMARPAFKTQLFRFTDVFPATTDDRDVMRHIEEYFDGVEVPKALDLGIDVAGHVPFGTTVSARVARRNIMRMAGQFIVGATAVEAVEGLHRLWRSGSAFTVDLLGEKTVVEAEADRYAARVDEMLRVLSDAVVAWAPDDHLERDDLGPLPRVNLSVKPTALATHYGSLTRDEGIASAAERLRPLLRVARDRGCHVHFDMEHYDAKDVTLALFRQLLSEDEFADLQAGTVIQAYLKDSRDDLADLIAWSSARRRPITVRLVKGAYWDTETVEARAAGWPSPVYEHKGETDANYERCVRLLHDHHGEVRAAFGSHNLRSLAYAIAYGRSKGIPDTGYELQMLYGMAEPMHAAVKRMGMRLRVYSPVGELVPGMAYLVRRLLENTSNESFVRARFAEGRALDELIAPPDADRIPPATTAVRVPPTDVDAPSPYHPEPPAEWRRSTTRAAFSVAVDRAPRTFPIDVPALIGGERFSTTNAITSVDPGHTDTVVATSASCTADDADRAVDVALGAAERWRHTPARERAAVLFRAAEWLRSRRPEMAALQVYEAGKPWDQADGDVCEAIDFCEYYGREMLRLDRGGTVQSPPGEANTMRYWGKGVGVVIAPWNFPLAIPCGMTVAALVAGNPVILKPAEQTPAIAWRLVEALVESGLPEGVLGFLPGIGEDVGARLVEHPGVSFIVFTGSKEVGLAINQRAAVPQPGQVQVKRVVAEMGGKNALVVDADADPDQAVPAAVYSAFGFAGQKCSAASRLIVHDAVYDQVVDRLVGATRELILGHPRRMSTQMGPVIDADAYKRINAWIERAPEQGRVVLAREDLPEGGYYVGPTIVTDVDPKAPIAREEIFGPVLSVLRAGSFDDAIAIANDTDYALTAGVFSRSPAHIRQAAEELRGGNVYVNRSTTGAVVGRQPFGGYAMSGVGSKAGGPDYLLQFVDPRVVTENTLRQGFAPDLTS